MMLAETILAVCGVVTALLGLYASPLGRPLRARATARRVAREENEQVRRIILGTPAKHIRGTVIPRAPGLQEQMANDVTAIRQTVENAALLNGKGEQLLRDVRDLKAWTVEHTGLHDTDSGVGARGGT